MLLGDLKVCSSPWWQITPRVALKWIMVLLEKEVWKYCINQPGHFLQEPSLVCYILLLLTKTTTQSMEQPCDNYISDWKEHMVNPITKVCGEITPFRNFNGTNEVWNG